MSTKKISVNPAFFKLNGSKTLKRREKREKRQKKELAKRENKELKMKLIDKIKEHKKRKKEQEKKEKNNKDDFENELEESLNYLQNLSTKHKSKKQKRRERKLARKMEYQKQHQQTQQQQQHQQTQQQQQHQQTQQQQQPNTIKINTDTILRKPLIQHPSIPKQPRATILPNTQQPIPSINILNNEKQEPIPAINYKPDPPYGILKHGKKPLFSIYNKTLKKQSVKVPSPIQIENNNVKVHTDPFFERRQKLEQLKQNNLQANMKHSIPTSTMPNRSKTLKKMKQLKTTTKRFIHLGKKNGKVGVLIKNQKTRRKILKDTNTLKKRPLSKIKKYLRKHNLIKIGSNAPEHIVRSIYENSFLSGDIYNKNIDTMLHNYLDN
jgi:type II secretory pathway pseudopilin PulG